MVHPLPSKPSPDQPVLKPTMDDKSRDGDPRQLDAELLLRETFAQDPRKGLELLFRKYHAPYAATPFVSYTQSK